VGRLLLFISFGIFNARCEGGGRALGARTAETGVPCRANDARITGSATNTQQYTFTSHV